MKADDTAPRKRARSIVYTFHMLTRQWDALRELSASHDIYVAEQIRRGIDLWIQQQKRRAK